MTSLMLYSLGTILLMVVFQPVLHTVSFMCVTEPQPQYPQYQSKESQMTGTSPLKGQFKAVNIYSDLLPPEGKAFSQCGQDQVVLAIFEENRKRLGEESTRQPYFVDLAANDPIYLSNTLLLEQSEWEGICIEPNPRYWYKLAAYRKCTIVAALVGGTRDQDGKSVKASFTNGELGGIVGREFDNKVASEQSEDRNLVSIISIFERFGVPHNIDYFNLDVEGAESLVMAQFPWDEYRFMLLTVERPKPDLDATLKEKGYVLVSKLGFFGEMLYARKDSVKLTVDEMRSIVEPLLRHDKMCKM